MDPQAQLAHWARLHQKDPQLLIKEIQSDIIASPVISDPPFGKKKSIYTDFFASSRPLKRFEAIMSESVLPFYANTHTSTTSTAKNTSMSVRLARETISRCTNANMTRGHVNEAAVIFSGDGSTSAINKVRSVFRLSDEAYWVRKAQSRGKCSQVTCYGQVDIDTLCSQPDIAQDPEQGSCCLVTAATGPSTSLYKRQLAPDDRPVVFLSIQEHHSNLLPWRESCADVIVIPEVDSSRLQERVLGQSPPHQLDLTFLEEQLKRHSHRPLKIGTFSAGSNLTGVLNDAVAISELLHKYGAFAFYDYAGVGPYTTIDMNPPPSSRSSSSSTVSETDLAYKDAVFISTHKFLGGPGASGVLVARLEVFTWCEKNAIWASPSSGQDSAGPRSSTESEDGAIVDSLPPTNPGGGTVDMVIRGRHKYINNVIAREEAGTPNILATIRTGLVFRLQEIMNPAWVLQKEYRLARMVYNRLLNRPEITVLGHPGLDRVAVFSLTVSIPRIKNSTNEQQRPLQIHYALLSTIMNDFFGIEMRGGCMCAGPYASQLLKFDAEREDAFWRLLSGHDNNENDFDDGESILEGRNSNGHSSTGGHRAVHHHHNSLQQSNNNHCSNCNIHQQELCSKSLKPGFVRFSFSYFARDKDVEFVVQSLEWVAQYGYLLLPLYSLNARTGEWTVRPAVRCAIQAEIQPKHRICGSREYCIPAAIDCIYGLKKLFNEEITPTWLWEDAAALLARRSSMVTAVGMTGSSADVTQPPLNPNSNQVHHGVNAVFSSVSQARRSLGSVLSNVIHSTQHRTQADPPNDSGQAQVPTPSDISNGSSGEEDLNDGHIPAVHMPESEVSSLCSVVSANQNTLLPLADASNTLAAGGRARSRSTSSASSSVSSSSSTLEGSITASSITPSTMSRAVKKPSIFKAERHIRPKEKQVLLDALDELEWFRLQSEHDVIETSELAKQLRWFVTPLEVARLYSQEIAHPSDPSLFPQRH
ncbi:hypothetical protein BGW38_010713 [Lunasporangiospora selenospora]|uniref:Aminotransferase class V domain-containing protein n=1 Tax=Lunasporangiospora selenospora TaxID=979761 RepID=A0A9P6FWP2_9FUNG|nr:hypothetical protein BGW38_010713 [Lunasporangiospora selenospora]